MTLDDLEAFQAFADCLNFTRAAEKLSISQPALHVKIKKLGESLNCLLYAKEGRKLVLTEDGKRFARYAGETLESHRRFVREMLGEDDTPSITLAAGSGSFLYLLGPAIRQFLADFEGELRLLTMNRPQALQALRLGTADLAVTVLSKVPPDLRGELLAGIPTQLVVPMKHRLSRRKRISPEDLAEESLIVPPLGRPFRDSLEACFSVRGVPLKVGLEAEGWQLMMHFASMGLGATLVNGCCKVPEDCKAVPVDGLPYSKYYLLQVKGRAHTPSIQDLTRQILTIRDPDPKRSS